MDRQTREDGGVVGLMVMSDDDDDDNNNGGCCHCGGGGGGVKGRLFEDLDALAGTWKEDWLSSSS